MPQVFGGNEIGLISQSSLWVEADYLRDVEADERALREAGFDEQYLPENLNREGFHPRGQVWGQHLTTDKLHHTWAIARVANPDINPSSREIPGRGGRYSVEIHKIAVRPEGREVSSVHPVWDGSSIQKFLTGQGAEKDEVTWPKTKRVLQSRPGRR